MTTVDMSKLDRAGALVCAETGEHLWTINDARTCALCTRCKLQEGCEWVLGAELERMQLRAWARCQGHEFEMSTQCCMWCGIPRREHEDGMALAIKTIRVTGVSAELRQLAAEVAARPWAERLTDEEIKVWARQLAESVVRGED